MSEQTVYINYPWLNSIWDEKILALKHRIIDYGDVDKIIKYMVEPHYKVGNDFSNILIQYHAHDNNFITNSTAGGRFPKKFIISELLPFIQKLALSLPTAFANTRIKILKSGKNCRLVLSRMQVACLLAGAFFGVFDSLPPNEICRGYGKPLSFLSIWKRSDMFILDSIIYYFTRIMNQNPRGDLIIKRLTVGENIPQWDKIHSDLSHIRIIDKSDILNTKLPLVLHGVSKNMCGGLYGGKNDNPTLSGRNHHAEEILFACFPELYIVSMFCEPLGEADILSVMGAEKFITHQGFGNNVKFYQGYNDETVPRSENGTIIRTFVLADVVSVPGQYTEFTDGFIKDLNKVLCGLNCLKTRKIPVACGLWGSNLHINGEPNKHLKFIQQYMVASLLESPVSYYAFDVSLQNEIDPFVAEAVEFVSKLNKTRCTVNDLYNAYVVLYKEIQRDILNTYLTIDLNTINVFKRVLDLVAK